jgi:GNAT superfamily N-acetyltransferase
LWLAISQVEKIRDKGYQKQFRDAWMFFEGDSKLSTSQDSPQMLTIKIVSNKPEIEDFMTVYDSVYGGEQTEDEPYGGLPPIYMTALRQSFSARDVQTFHFVGYKEDQPVAVATLVYADGWGGIYNAGTLATHRRQGIGTLLSHVCIDKWKEQGGHTLFLQTEVASKQEKFYKELGFKTAFVGECWAK